MATENFTLAFERIESLVAIFQENESFYLSPGYNEADARKDFIDKFWMALGWDVNHETQTDPYKQIIPGHPKGTPAETLLAREEQRRLFYVSVTTMTWRYMQFIMGLIVILRGP